MNTPTIEKQKHKDTRAMLDIYRTAKSDYSRLIDETVELQRKLNEVRLAAQRKARIIKALQEAILVEANDGVPDEVMEQVPAAPSEERLSPAHALVRRRMVSGRGCVLEAAKLVKESEIENIGIEPKAIYNVLAYLSSRGQLKKIGRGRYRIVGSGCGVETVAQLSDDEVEMDE